MSLESIKLRRTRKWGNDNHQLKGTREYLAKCTDINDGPEVAAAGAPAIGTAWSVDFPFLWAKSVEANEYENSGVYFIVTVNYETPATKEQKDKDTEPDPLSRPAQVSQRFDVTTEEAFEAAGPPDAIDQDGAAVPGFVWHNTNVVCNSAKQKFHPSITQNFYDIVYTITRNEAAADFDRNKQYMNKVNSDAFTITYKGTTYNIAIGEAKVLNISTRSMEENGVSYDEVTYEIAIREGGWRRKVLDQGLEQLTAGDLPRKPIRDGNGDPVTVAHPLDGKGQALATGGKLVFLRFPMNQTKVFSSLAF